MKILFSVLNWGLGHASRSIPLIHAAEAEGFEPVIASDGEALLLLRKEFPHINWHELPPYNINYPKNGRNYKLHFLKKGLSIMKAVKLEHRRVEEILSGDRGFVGVVSDNRLGAYSRKVPAVYITHQIKVFSGSTTGISSRMHRFFINKYSVCWVPDFEGDDNLSGEMGHNRLLKIPVSFIGPLSRFRKKEMPQKFELLVLLSGPEPQRSLLEEHLLKELEGFKGRILFVRGKMEEMHTSEIIRKLEVHNFLFGKALEKALNESGLVIARSGYSTLMDLSELGKKAFFIPTPGQREQEYLANLIQVKKIAPFCSQKDFSLEKLEETAFYSGFTDRGVGSRFTGLFALFQGE